MAIGQAISLRYLLLALKQQDSEAELFFGAIFAGLTVISPVLSRFALCSAQWLGLRVRIAVTGLVYRNVSCIFYPFALLEKAAIVKPPVGLGALRIIWPTYN